VLRVTALAVLALACALWAPAAQAANLYPWPSDRYTRPDATTATGLRLNLQLADMPTNVAGKPVDPTEFNRNDGFSPGSLIIARVPGLDTQAAFDRTGLVPITDVARSFDSEQPAVVIDAATGQRQLIWSELEYPADLNPDPSQQTLVIHPARNLREGHHYVVALRRLRRADGSFIAAPGPSSSRDLSTLKRFGVSTNHLYLAWDFTVASERSLSERMLHIRDDAFAQLGDKNLGDLKVSGSSPTFFVNPDLPDNDNTSSVDGITNFTPEQNPRIARIVRGRVLVPCYLTTPDCATGGGFDYGLDGLPAQLPGNTDAANFVCIIPRSVLTQGPARPSLYGHGLLGTADQVDGGAQERLAFEHNITLCATDWIGMAQEDIPNDVAILGDLSRFNTLADRNQQGMLNFLFLGRALVHPDGMSKDPAFIVDGHPAIDTSRLYYDGGSQGGIMGGSLAAVAPDLTRAALGVPAMNYSILLQRSVDFDEFATVFYRTYPNQLERPLLLALIQLLWDRGEADGYAWHMTDDPYPNTPAHQVLMQIAWGDHQVSNWAAMVEARTIGARLRTPILDPGRDPEVNPFYGIPRITSFPTTGSAMSVWDVGPLRTLADGTVKGTPPPPTGNEPNRPGVDPHGPDASEQVTGRDQVSAFLQPDAQSQVIDECGAAPCYLDGWTGP
jgi:hypothetical protein